MKPLICLTLCVGLAWTAARAANPVPYMEAVSFSYQAVVFNPDGQQVTGLTVYDESGPNYPHLDMIPGTSPAESGMHTAWLRPGVRYPLSYYANRATEYWLSFIAPAGYRLVVENAVSRTEMNLVHGTTDGTTHNHDYYIQLLPRMDVAKAAPFGSFSGIQVGQSVAWSIGLGGTQLDRSAGRIGFREYDLSGSPASRERLFLSTTQYNIGETWSINDGTLGETLRQVMSPEGVVDILDDGSGGYHFRFFLHSQSEGSPGNPNILYGSPWKTIHVQSLAANQLKITETEGSATRVSQLTLTSGSVGSGNYGWTLQEGDGTTWLRTTTHTSATVSGGREEVVEVYTGGGTGTPVAKTKYRYENVGGWGEEVVQVVQDPDNAALTTTYTYHTNSGYRGDYRKIRSVTTPTGGWTAYDYYDDWDTRGQIMYEFGPYLDSPATVPSTLPSTHTGYTGKAVYRTYLADWTGRKTRPDLQQIWLNGTSVAKTEWVVGDVYPTGDSAHETTLTKSYSDDSYCTQDYFESWRRTLTPQSRTGLMCARMRI